MALPVLLIMNLALSLLTITTTVIILPLVIQFYLTPATLRPNLTHSI